MSTKFHPLPVRAVEKTTADCVVVELDVPPELRETFHFKHGQHLTFKQNINGEEVRRSYSLCSAPGERRWQVAIKQVPDGRFSTFANQVLQPGMVLETLPPNGRFYVEVEPERQKHYVAFAAGSGITPILSIIKTHLAEEPKSTFKLFYTNQAVSTIILKEALEGLKNVYLDRLEIFHFLTREKRSAPLFNGRMSAEKLDIIFKVLVDKDEVDDVFICGPNAMIFMIRDYLKTAGMETGKIHFELFNTDGIAAPKAPSTPIDQTDLSEINIREGGKMFTFKMPKGANNILDAALNNSADLPFACKGGVCCTCRAKLIAGKVDILLNYGLEQEEIDNGYILTCQAIPQSDKVVVDFDEQSN